MIVFEEMHRDGLERNEKGIDRAPRPSPMLDREQIRNLEVKKEMARELAEMGFSSEAIERILHIGG